MTEQLSTKRQLELLVTELQERKDLNFKRWRLSKKTISTEAYYNGEGVVITDTINKIQKIINSIE